MDNFRIIGFTLPDSTFSHEEEALTIQKLLSSDAVDLFHIRKKEVPDEKVARLIESLPSELHNRLILHSNFSLFSRFDFGGFHYKEESRLLIPPSGRNVSISRSCHSIAELCKDSARYNYSFLSPVFDSISKRGYTSNFNLSDASLPNVLKEYPVIALGGVRPEYFQKLNDVKFAGAALLGYLWSQKIKIEDTIDSILSYRKLLKN